MVVSTSATIHSQNWQILNGSSYQDIPNSDATLRINNIQEIHSGNYRPKVTIYNFSRSKTKTYYGSPLSVSVIAFSPTPTPTPPPSPTATPRPTATPTPLPSPTATPRPPTPTPTPTATPRPSPSATPTPTPGPTNMDQDWEGRTSAAGVFYAHNFTYKDRNKTQLIKSNADLAASSFQVGGATDLILWDTTHKLSGAGSMKLSMPAGRRGVSSGYGLSFDGVGTKTKNTSKHQFYVQFAVYADSVYRNFYYGSGNVWGGKIAIVEAPDQSYAPSEIVLRRDPRAGGFLQGYRYTPMGGAEGFGLSWASLWNYTYMNFYDAGSPTVVDNVTLRRRHGPDYLSQDDSQGTNPDYQNAPRLVSNGWTVFEIYIDQVNQVVKIWCAPYGSEPKLIIGSMNARLAGVGTMDPSSYMPAQIYSGMQLLNYHNNVTNWPSTDTFIGYTEVIGSDNPIKFPGGFSIPHPGATHPPNYPPAGASEL